MLDNLAFKEVNETVSIWKWLVEVNEESLSVFLLALGRQVYWGVD